MAPNIIEILVVAKDSSKAGIEGAEKGFKGLALAAGAMAAGVGFAMVDIGVHAVEMASKFDAEMMKLHTQAHVAMSELPGLKKGILDLAGKVGQDPDSLAEALYHVESNFASLGITSAKALELTKIAAEGASVGGADLVDVTNALTAAVASGIPGVENISKAMGVLNATVGAGDMQMQDLADAMGTGFLATVKQFGLSINDVGAALATFGDNNIRGAKAGTQLRMAVQALAVPTKDGKAQLEAWGMTADQLAKDMQHGGLLQALDDLRAHMTAAGITSKEQGQIITDMFGKKAGVGIAILFDQLDRVKSKYPELTKGANDFGDAWAKTGTTLKQEFADIKAGADAMLIRLGEGLTPYVEKGIAKLGDFANFLKNTFGGSIKSVDGELAKLKPGTLKELSKDYEDLKHAISDNKSEIELTLRTLGLVLGAVVKYGPALAGQFALAIREFGIFVDGTKMVIKASLFMFKMVVDNAALAFGWIPGIGPKLRAAAKEVDKFANDVNSFLDGIHDKDVTVRIHLDNQMGPGPGTSRMPGYAHGGITGAASGMLTGGGWTMVGEYGRELVKLAPGSTVIPHGTTERMMSQDQGSHGVPTYTMIQAGDEMIAGLIRLIQRYVRNAGGDGRTLGIVTVRG